MRTLYVRLVCCLAIAVMFSQARYIPKRYVGTGLFLGKMNGLSPNNTYSDSETGSTTPDENDVASGISTLETASDVAPTIVLAASEDSTSSFDGMELPDVTTIGSVVLTEFEATFVPTVTPESGSVKVVDSEITGDVSAGLNEHTKASALVGIDYEATTMVSVDGDATKSFGITGETGEIREDASVDLDETTTAAVVGNNLEAIGSSIVTKENAPNDNVNDEIIGDASTGIFGTTIATAVVDSEYIATTSSSTVEGETVFFGTADGTIGGDVSNDIDGTTTAAVVEENLEASFSSVTTDNSSGDNANGEIKGDAFNGALGTTIATDWIEGEFKASSTLAGEETVSVSESTGVDSDKVSSGFNVGSEISSGSEIASNGKQSSDGNLDSNIISTNSVQAKADQKFISETSALNVYKLEPINQVTVEATKGKEAVLIYELATAKYKRQLVAV